MPVDSLVPFGAPPERVAAALTTLANKLLSKAAGVQTLTETVESRSDVYQMKTLSVTYFEPDS